MGAMRSLPLLLLLLMLAIPPSLYSDALPLIEVWVEDAAAKQVALSDELMAYLSENGTLTILSDQGKYKMESSGGRLVAGRDVFLQREGTLYLVTEAGLRRIMDCNGCSFFPYSEDKIAIVDSRGLLLILNGEKRRLQVKGIVRWSDDGQRLSIIAGDELLVVNTSGFILWRKDLNTQLFDVEPDDLTYVCMKGCEIYAINDKSFVTWTSRLCKCCIPGKLDRTESYLLVLVQGRELVVLNASDGRKMQSMRLGGYEIDAILGIVAVRDGEGRIHMILDADRLHIRGESGGILVSWDVPGWFRLGNLTMEHPWGKATISVGENRFVPIPKDGEINVTFRGISGEFSSNVIVGPLNVTVTPFGDVNISGDGSFEVEVDGKRYVPPARVDTGWLPIYSVRVYNHGVKVAELDSVNAKFLLLAFAFASAIVVLRGLRARSSGGEKVLD